MKKALHLRSHFLNWTLLVVLLLSASIKVSARVYDGTEKIYLRPLAVSWWLNDNAKVGMYFFNDIPDPDTFQWVELNYQVTNGDQIWSAIVPQGDWNKVIVTRHTASVSQIGWENKLNQSGNITIPTDNENYIYSFSEGSPTATWIKPAYFRSSKSGNLNDISTWENSYDQSTWSASTQLPNVFDLSVSILNSHTVNLYQAYSICSLTINAGAFVVQGNNDFTIYGDVINNGTYSFVGDGSKPLVVKGDVTNSATGTITLSATVGGDLKLEGNLIDNGTFNSNTRAVFFTGTAKQTVSTTSIPIGIDYLINDNNSTDGLHINSPLTSINITNNGKLTIASGVTVLTSGTVSGSGTTNVNQTLSGGGRQWWYLSSPLASVSSSIFGTDKVGKYIENYGTDKTAPYYTQPFTTPENLEVGRGYIVKRTSTDEATYTFTGGSLNSGNLTITPTRTGTTAGKRGFNLIGNPYPSYINWDDVYVNEAGSAVNMRNAIWFRTYNSELTSDSKMEFQTYSDGEGVPDVATKQIAPMQAFWVRVDADNTPASLTFKNTHRSHMEATGYNPLKAKSADLRPRVRLVISNGEADDEMLLVGKSYAANGLDSYDIEKLSNDNAAIPELYSLVENQELVINSMQELNAGKWVMLGMRPGEAGSFNITASQLDNIDVMVVLKDRLLNVEKELTLGETYSFTSDGIASNDRFSLEFRAPGTVTSVNNLVSDAQIFINENRQLTVQAPGITLNDRISIYNMAGQQLLTQQANGPVTVLAEPLSIGVYIVKVNELVQKVVVK